MRGPLCWRAMTISKPSKPPHHRTVGDRHILSLHSASSWAVRDAALLHWICAHYCWWKTPAHTPEQWRDILLSTACRATLHPSLYRGRGGRAGQARLEFLSFDGMGGGVQACNQTHCLYNQFPVRRIQAMLNYRHTDSVLFGNRTCCTIKTFRT